MDFRGFLSSVRVKGQFGSSREFFDSLNQDGNFDMSLRNFQLLEKGDQPPSFRAFSFIFKKIRRSDYRNSVISFLETNLADVEGGNEILEYVRSHLAEAVEESNENIWATKRPMLYYSTEQMQELTSDLELLRLHHTLLLYDDIHLDEIPDIGDLAKRLVDLELAIIDGKTLSSIRTLVRVPNFDNAAPNVVRKASKMLLKHLDLYASLEGSENQVISYVIQHVAKDRMPEVFEKMEKFKKWMQTLASPKTDDSVVPFIHLSWGKALSKKDLSYGKNL